jgi:hypothetical protein
MSDFCDREEADIKPEEKKMKTKNKDEDMNKEN